MPTALDIAAHLDALLNVGLTPDYPQALNGLQLSNRGEITRVATAVDFSSRTVAGAVREGAQMLLVHHGMFWSGIRPIVGEAFERLRLLVEHDVAVYSAHLPLDLHPEVGNNVLLARALGLQPEAGFARFKTIDIGVSGRANELTLALAERVRAFSAALGSTLVTTPFDASRRTSTWAVCSGAGASSETVAEARSRGIDTLIVGEGPHHTAVQARDEDIVVMYAGHYATETLGVRSLGERLAGAFGLESIFLHEPTGL